MTIVHARAASSEDSVPTLRLIPSEEEVMLREAVRAIATEFGPDYYIGNGRPGSSQSQRELMQALGRQGFLGVHLPTEYGGGGRGIQELAAVLEETAAVGCPTIALVFSAGIVGTILAKHGAAEQKAQWLTGVATGELAMSFAITEADAGSNSHNITTSATRGADGSWTLRGEKTYISGLDDADAVLVVARTGTDATTGRGMMSLFIVDVDAPGVSRHVIPTVIGMPERQWTLHFDDVLVGSERLIGAEGTGFRIVFDGLNPERVLAAAMCCGLARYALDKATSYANQRTVWNCAIGAHQAVAHPLAEAKIELEHARLMMQKAAALFDAGLNAGETANMCKLAAADAAAHSLDRAIQAHGGNGLAEEYQLANYWFLVRFLRIAPVSREMVLNFVAQHSLGLPRSY